MIFKIEITEKMKDVVEVKARNVTEALAKAERMYYADKCSTSLANVEFSTILDDKSIKRIKNE